MLSENIRILRKKKGYSQDTLATQLNVVRQTISKWEKGYSVPDAEMLEKIADVFEVSVSELLGSTIIEDTGVNTNEEIVKQLAILNEQLAKQSRDKRRMWRNILIGILSFLVISMILYILAFASFTSIKSSEGTSASSTQITCTLEEETYTYTVSYDDQYRILSAGGNQFIADHVQVEKYNDANVLFAQIEDYFIFRNGSCRIENIDQEQ
ncbi:MAG: helix-turn-helix transcriptional regulator [Erysipelotrichales bacterium]|nr:helix-turn-helix transcriptional regulator [Erysipelotrichales bacterium]